jgi:hypothetical protein
MAGHCDGMRLAVDGPAMGHPLRQYLPSVLYEVTIRVAQGRYLLRPDGRSRAIVNGVIARAQVLYPNVKLHAFDCQSNHLHQLLSSSDGESIARYLCFVHGSLARLIGRLRGWEGRFWSRRCRVIPVLDDAAAVDRLRYIVAQGVAAGLVASPRDWPGASSTPGLIGAMTISAQWLSLDLVRRNARRGTPVPLDSLQEQLAIKLTPIPPWAELSCDAVVALHTTMIDDIEREHAGRRVVGASRLRSQDPLGAPATFAATPAPPCHGSTPEIRERFRAAYRRFRDAFIAAAARVRAALAGRGRPSLTGNDGSTADFLRDAHFAAGFPIGSCPRTTWFIRAVARVVVPPWAEPIAAAA